MGYRSFKAENSSFGREASLPLRHPLPLGPRAVNMEEEAKRGVLLLCGLGALVCSAVQLFEVCSWKQVSSRIQAAE